VTTDTISEENEEALVQEVDLLVKTQHHPNIVSFFGVSLHKNAAYLVMEFFNGGSVESAFGTLSIVDKVDILRQSSVGIAHLHKQKIIHRDLACRNLLINNDSSRLRVVVSDFGFSREVTEGESSQTKSSVGPVRWMAPESILHQQYSEKTDVWSFGAMVYELIEEEIPFKKLGNLQVAMQVTSKGLQLFPSDGAWPPKLEEILADCHRRDPDERLTMTEVRGELIQLFQQVRIEFQTKMQKREPVSTTLMRPTSDEETEGIYDGVFNESTSA